MDNSATTAVYPQVVELMSRIMLDDYGNPSSKHNKGVEAEHYVTQAKETLASILGGGDLSTEEEAVYTEKAVNLTKLSESETKIESLVMAQGFEDCVVYLDGETANIVVRTEGLSAEDAAKIKDILLSEVSISSENIRIFEVK